ncbi:MAG TPA: bifunctional 5,10-methylenetetrahydrofolate dehydrogenase/5,10-methenyltetrahydrofolate cyclohydrolase [Dongiaceae bacterium]|nr:bifunctional 5,10-methylenetetrahydrofolate dehydrogenase/5,10-methenyltetrahydrofolate cyclohydrolase [Dongiaceae bacterium]
MKILDGRELVGYIKERQAKQVRGLRQAWHVLPKLAIIIANNDPVIDTYVRLKERYGEDILIDVDVYRVAQAVVAERIEQLNHDETVHGIVVQLPLQNPEETDAIVALIHPDKDVDGLGPQAAFTSATATAIDWLLAGYNVALKDREIAIVGRGRLVGAPLARLWLNAGLTVASYDETATDLQSDLRKADIIVTATGVPGLITSSMVSPGKVVVDAGTASENGAIVGDVAVDVRERNDLTITPEKGGVGPLTVAALFDNVMTAARKTIPADQQ